MKVAFIYDRIAPETLGGAERFYAGLTRTMAAAQPVTYVTRRYWAGSRVFYRDGVQVVAVSRAGKAAEEGARRFVANLLFALGVAWYLLRHGRQYGVVHVCCFPPGAAIAARVGLLPHPGTRLVVDWHEVLTRSAWRLRFGRLGHVGWLAQRVALVAGHGAVTFSRMHEKRLVAEGASGSIRVIPEFYTGEAPPAAIPGGARDPLVVFAGRLVLEKRPHLIPAVVAALRRAEPGWRGIVFGTGPAESLVRDELKRTGVADAVDIAGFAPWTDVAAAFGRARALVLPSMREGFGLVVLEAAAHGVPSVLVGDPDNAAVELIENDVNGLVVQVAEPELLASAVLQLTADPAVHAKTRAWYDRASTRLNVNATAEALRAFHAELRWAS